MTQFGILYELKDTTALADSTAVTAANQAFADAGLLRRNLSFPDYGTLEQDYFLLDGTHPEFPDGPEGVPFFTAALSGADGRFAKNPLLTVVFTQNHTSAGLTFHFVGDWPLDMRIRWYDLEGRLLDDKVFLPDRADYFAGNLVEDYGRLEVEFRKTGPCRYVRLSGIDYGVTVEWDERNLKSASLTEETDPVSDKIPVNKLTFQFVDAEEEYNVGNQNGLHRALQKRQHISPYETVDGRRISLGRYFLDTSSGTQNTVSMTAVDYKGLLDNEDFMEGRVYTQESAGRIIEEILEGTQIPYEIDKKTCAVRLSGWLAVQSRRKALREVLFACGSLADTSGLDCLRIYRSEAEITGRLPRSRKFSTTAREDPCLSEVSVKYSVYTPETESKEILKGTYPAGINTVRFSSPVEPGTVRIAGGTLQEAKTNYAVFSLPVKGEVTITGAPYKKQDLAISAVLEPQKLQAGENRSSKSYSGTLLDPVCAKLTAERILHYYGNRLLLKLKYLAGGERPGAWAEVENASAGRGSYAACLESITTNLTGGYVSNARLRGYYRFLAAYQYAGEGCAGESVGVM